MCASGIAERRRPRGAALIISMLIMAVLLLAGTTFMTISSTESQIALNETSLVRAFHAAESALQKTIVTLNQPGNSGYTGGSGTLSSGVTYTVAVTPAASQPCPTSDARTIAARGSVNVQGALASVDLWATVDRISYPFRFAAFSTVPNTIVTGTRVESELLLEPDAKTDSFDSGLGAYDASMGLNNPPTSHCPGGVACGNKARFGRAGANGDATVSDDSTHPNYIYGDLRVGDAVTNSRITVSGLRATGLSPDDTSPQEPFQSVSPPVTPTAASTGSLTLGDTDPAVPRYYYYTTMSFANSTTLTVTSPVTIYVSNGVSVGDNVTWGNSSNPTWLKVVLKSTGSNTDSVDFTTGNHFTLHGALYGRNTDISLGVDSVVYGSVIGRTVRLDNRTLVHYDQALALQPVCHTGRYQVRKGTWREVLPSW